MMFKKSLRDMKKNRVSFIAILLLSFMAMYMYAGIASSNVGIKEIRGNYHETTNLADGWLYGAEFTTEDIEALEQTEDITGAQLRTELSLETEDNNPIKLYLEDENKITMPYKVEGEEYDPQATDGIWLNSRFAEENHISVGDSFTLSNGSFHITETVRGLIMTPEFEYYKASSDLEPDFSNIGYAYMSRKAFPEERYMEAMTGYGGSLPWNQILLTSSENIMSLENTIAESLTHSYTSLLDQESFSGLSMLQSEIDQHDLFAEVFPLVFLIIALLAIMTTMNRIISDQRVQIGTLKAMGMKESKINRSYISSSVILVAIGCALGTWLGPKTMGPLFNDFMPESYTMPSWDYGYSASFVIIGIGLVLVSGLTAYLSCRKLIRTNTVEILYPRSAKKAKKCIFEKLPGWDKMKFSTRYNLRDISRSKLRSVMVVIGVTGGMLLTLCAFGCNDTVNDMESWVFEKLQNYQYQITLESSATLEEMDQIAEDTAGELIMTTPIEISSNEHCSVNTVSTAVVTENKGIYKVTDESRNIVELGDDQLAVTKKLAEKYGISQGDTIKWHLVGKEEWIESKVSIINRNPNVTGITLGRTLFEQVNGKDSFKATTCVTNKEINNYANANIKEIHNRKAMTETWNTNMESYMLMISIFICLALFLTIIVIYNSGALSFNERKKEFATLKVQGFNNRQLRNLLFKENLWLTILGVIIGMPLGRWLLQYMFDTNGDEMDYEAVVSGSSYILSALIIICTAIFVNLLFSKKMKKIEIVETLKPAE